MGIILRTSPRSYAESKCLDVVSAVDEELATPHSYLVNVRMILAEMCKKKMDAMKDRERTSTMNGSL
jgi:hypothetical protein